MTVDRKRVQSSVVVSIGFDAMSNTLEVEFRNGGLYRYLDVPKQVYWRFVSAESHGEFLNTEIKDRFTERKVR